MDCRAFVHIDYDPNYDDPPEIKVHDDPNQVLYYDIHECGRDFFDRFIDGRKGLKTGYFFMDYKWHNATESWEMPSITYPEIDDWNLKPCRLGWLYLIYTKIKYFVLRIERYGY